jgi:AcrR family transcriptional regulator
MSGTGRARAKRASSVSVAPRSRGKRAMTLTPDAIVDAALDLTEREGAAALSLRRLGEELGVDATAFYRHFRDKDDLVLAAFDRVIGIHVEQARATYPRLDWRETLRVIANESWTICGRYPAIFSLAFSRPTGGPAEREIVELMLSTLSKTGLSPADTVLHYRTFVDALVAMCGMRASVVALGPQLHEKDASARSRIYALLPQAGYPAARKHAEELAAITDDTIFHAAIEAIICDISSAIDRATAERESGA